jgi:hypothetical protein
MKAFLKKWWWLIAAAVVAALVIWRLWPKVPGVKRKIDFIDLPLIVGGGDDAITSDDERDKIVNEAGHQRMLDLIDESAAAIAAYDNG